MNNTNTAHSEFAEWFEHEYPIDENGLTRSKFQSESVPNLMRAAYAAGRAAAEQDRKHARRWRQVCKAVKDGAAVIPNYATLWGDPMGMYVRIVPASDGKSSVKVSFYYKAPAGIGGDLDAALDLIDEDRNG